MRYHFVLALHVLAWPTYAAVHQSSGVFKAHDNGVHDLELADDGKLLVTAGGDGFVSTWNPETLLPVRKMQFKSELRSFDVSFLAGRPNLIISAPHGGDPFISDATTGALLHTITDHTENVARVASVDGHVLTAGSDDVVYVWKGDDWQRGAALPMKSPVGLAPVPGPKAEVVTASLSGLQLWDFSTGALLRTYEDSGTGGDDNVSVAMHPSGHTFATGSTSRSAHGVRLWSVESGNIVGRFAGLEDGFVWQLGFSRDGALLVAVDYGGEAIVWDSSSRRVVFRSNRDEFRALSAVIAPGNETLWIGDTDGHVRRIDLNP